MLLQFSYGIILCIFVKNKLFKKWETIDSNYYLRPMMQGKIM